MKISSSLFLACTGLAAAKQAADFNLTATDAAKYDCQGECQTKVAQAEPIDLS